MNKIFFTSDFHVGHKNIIRFDGRPFTSAEEMNEALIANWNSVVDKDSVVYYAGDLSFCNFNKTKEFVDRLNGTIHFICGNHDYYKEIKKLDRFETIERGYMELKFSVPTAHKGELLIVISHYPILVWNKHHYGAIHLHGHCHGNLMKSLYGMEYYKRKVIDIGCNLHNYTPINVPQVMELTKDKEIILIDQI